MNFLFWSLLGFLLKPVKKNYQITFVEAAENSKNSTSNFNADFKKSVSTSHVVKKLFWNLVHRAQYFENILNFLLNLCRLSYIELSEMMSMENELSFCPHAVKLTIKLTFYKN